MNVANKIYDRMQQYQRLHNKPPRIILLTAEELEEVWLTSNQARNNLISNLALLNMTLEMIAPEHISNIMKILTDEQLTILLTDPDQLTRKLAEQEIADRQAKKHL